MLLARGLMAADRPLEIVDDKGSDWHPGFFSSYIEFAKGKEQLTLPEDAIVFRISYMATYHLIGSKRIHAR